MLEAAIIGTGRSTPGWCSSRRRIRRFRRASWRWTLAFTRKPPGGEGSRGVNHLDCSLKQGGFRASGSQRAWGDAWLRTNSTALGCVPSTTLYFGEIDAECAQLFPGPLHVALPSLGIAPLRPRDLPHRLRQQLLLRPP